ncbi:MAG: winged helix-turn-helix domain-containing protein, partial [Blautia wexlerae]
LKRREVVRDNRKIELTYTEFEILQLLAQNPGRVFSKEQIYDIVWKESYFGDYNIVMSHISHIREKIEDDPGNPVYIQTVWGVGYKFNEKAGSE